MRRSVVSVSVFCLALCALLALPVLAGAGGSASKVKPPKGGHGPEKGGHAGGKACKHGYKKDKRGKCRPTEERDVVSGSYTGGYVKMEVDADGRKASFEWDGIVCSGIIAFPSGGPAVTGSMSKSTVGAKLSVKGSYSGPYEGTSKQDVTWEMTGTFTTRTNFNGTLHFVATIGPAEPSPNVGSSTCDTTTHVGLGFAG